jgi:CRP/FNR family cyclic AMP-dependent transcriptional regulator
MAVPALGMSGGRTARPPSMAELIAAHPFAHDMPPRLIERISDFAIEAEFAAGETILREGDPANRFYLILEGHVELESYQGERGRVRVQTLGPGEVLGFSWLFPPYFWRFDAHALEPTRTLFIYGTPLRDLCEEDAELGRELYKRIAALGIERLQATRRRLLNLATGTMTGVADRAPELGETPNGN